MFIWVSIESSASPLALITSAIPGATLARARLDLDKYLSQIHATNESADPVLNPRPPTTQEDKHALKTHMHNALLLLETDCMHISCPHGNGNVEMDLQTFHSAIRVRQPDFYAISKVSKLLLGVWNNRYP